MMQSQSSLGLWLARRGITAVCGAGASLFAAVLDFLIADACIVCGRAHAPTRDNRIASPRDCLSQPVAVRYLKYFALDNHPVCARCRDELVLARTPGRLSGLPVRVFAPFMTTEPLLRLVRAAKFNGYWQLLRPLADAIAWDARARWWQEPRERVLVPVPMLGADEARRGYNQSHVIATRVADVLAIPLWEGALQKTRRTRRQSETPRGDRVTNVRGAFAYAGPEWRGETAVIVDDLVTSGATAAACAAALASCGCRFLEVICIARAL